MFDVHQFLSRSDWTLAARGGAFKNQAARCMVYCQVPASVLFGSDLLHGRIVTQFTVEPQRAQRIVPLRSRTGAASSPEAYKRQAYRPEGRPYGSYGPEAAT